MEDRPGAGPAEASRHSGGGGASDPYRHLTGQAPAPGRGTNGQDDHTSGGSGAEAAGDRPAGLLQRARDYLPRGRTLDPETFQQRHRLLSWLLGLHLVPLFIFGLWMGYDTTHVALELQAPLVCLVLARSLRPGRFAAFFTTAGLVYCSAALVHLSGGMIESHFHFFILVGFIALYQDWVPFLWNVAFVVVSHGVGSTVDAESMFNHYAAQNKPWLWASIHGVAVLCACIGVIIFWRQTELVERRNFALREQLTGAELLAAESEVARRRSVSALLVHLARRNQALLDRQLSLIADLEDRERQPEPLSELFRLDHLATRMRRNAESLLVLSGDEPPRRWRQPVPLEDVVRAAAAEVEAYERVEVLVSEHLEVEGRAVADLTHLLAELIENATVFSPPSSEVRINSYLSPDRTAAYLLSIEDMGVGMPEEDLRLANEILADAPEIDLGWQTLGLHVVGRLARRHDLQVRLAATPGRGVTALVTLPRTMVDERRPEPVGVAPADEPPAPIVRPAPTVPPAATPPGSGAPAAPVAPVAGAGSAGSGGAPPVPVSPGDRTPAVPPELPRGSADLRNDPPGWSIADPAAAARMALPREGETGAGPSRGWTAERPEGEGPGPGHHPLRPEVPAHVRRPPPPSSLPGPGQSPHQGQPPHPVQPPHPGQSPGEAAPPAPPAGSTAEVNEDGLVRRVPGQHLAAALRRERAPEPPADDDVDRDASRSSLSRFQASQRAGRAVASGGEGSGAEQPAAPGDQVGDPTRHDHEAVDGNGGMRPDAPTDR